LLASGVLVGDAEHEIGDVEERDGQLLLVAENLNPAAPLHHEKEPRAAGSDRDIDRVLECAYRNRLEVGGVHRNRGQGQENRGVREGCR
jgi:hypothetical protein